MSSLFDGLTVSAPGLGVDTQGPFGSPSGSSTSSILPGSPAVSVPPVAVVPAAMPVPVGPTGLIARIEPDEFVKLVSQTGNSLVLYTAQTKVSGQRLGNDRYVASVGGIVFITHAGTALRFPSQVKVVIASAVLCNGRPLSNEDFV